MEQAKNRFYLVISAGLVLLFSMWTAGCVSQSKYIKTEGNEGERLYRAKCTSCHRLMSPAEHQAEKWTVYVEKYGNKIGLTDEEKKKILDYLTLE